jgi:ABC-type branched-subunit amino acid transport system substrate-binding protein
VFILWPPPSSATRLLADAIAEGGFKKVSAIISDNTYYKSLFAALRPELEARGIVVADELSFAPGVMDYRSAIVRITKSKSEAVITFLQESGEFASFLRQRKELGFTVPLFGANTIPFDPIVQKNLTLANGFTYFDYITLGTPEFLKRYELRFKGPAGLGSAKAYDGVHLIANAIKDCGFERSQIRECLRKASLRGVSGGIDFDSTGVINDRQVNAKLLVVRDGKIVDAR